MELCGWELPTILGLLALALFIPLVQGRPRQREGWVAHVQRASMLVGLNLAVVATMAALLNNQYAFFTSWGDLVGGSPPPQTRHYGGSTAAAQAPLVGSQLHPTSARALPKVPQPGKRMQKYQVVGAKSHFSNEVLVRLPKHYNPHSGRRYPVLLALHGFPGHPKSFEGISGFFDDLDKAASTGKMSEAIVVMPMINHPSTLDTECVDAPGGPQAETWLSYDVPHWITSHFAVKPERQAWAAYGYSFGGWCAAMLGMKHPDVFGGAVVLQGYFRPEFDETFRPFRVGSAAYSRYDLVRQARTNPPPLALWIMASKPDRVSYPSSKQFMDAARAPLSITANIADWGGHRNGVWEGMVPQTFAWLGRTLPGFRPH